MGRQQYLERLALGRSAFQSSPAVDNWGNTESERPQSIETPNSAAVPPQQYDTKGRPTNPATDALNANLRHASNEVLALVGVVERKDSADAQMQIDSTLRRATREHQLILEDNRGNEWSAGLDVLSWFVMWWPTALVRRVQIGIYSTDLSFTEILSLEASMMLGTGWRGILLGLLPGTGIAILHKVLWQISALIAEESIGLVQNRIVASNIRRRTAKRLIQSLTLLMDVFYVLIDVALLPLETYALARQLSIAPPTTPWRPLLKLHIPSLFRSTYASTFTNPTALLASAAPHLLAYSLLTRDPSPEAPAFSDITTYRLPSISEQNTATATTTTHSNWPHPPPSPYDPFAAILRQTRLIRQRLLRAVCWDLHERNRPGATHGWETDAQIVEVSTGDSPDSSKEDNRRRRKTRLVAHRSTSLARLPATWLGFRTDLFLLRLLMLPIESAVMRRVAGFYISSGMPVAGSGVVGTGGGDVMMVGNAVTPRLWDFVTGRVGRESFGVAARRLSQVGLSVVFGLGVEVVFFGVVYGLVRRDGVARFGWKKADGQGRREDVVAEEEEEEDLIEEGEGRVIFARDSE